MVEKGHRAAAAHVVGGRFIEHHVAGKEIGAMKQFVDYDAGQDHVVQPEQVR